VSNTRKTPLWAREYLAFSAWSADELRNLLCGLPPVQPIDAPPRTREETNDAFVRDELKRVAADRHIRDAIATGYLKIVEPPDDGLLEKIRPIVNPEELQRLIRAVAHERTCSKSYRVDREAAIRWAASRRDVFPDFPFTTDDVRPLANASALDGGPAERLKSHRSALVRQALRNLDLGKAEFCRAHDISTDTLRGMVNGDTDRYGQEKKITVLGLLNISEVEWDSSD